MRRFHPDILSPGEESPCFGLSHVPQTASRKVAAIHLVDRCLVRNLQIHVGKAVETALPNPNTRIGPRDSQWHLGHSKTIAVTVTFRMRITWHDVLPFISPSIAGWIETATQHPPSA